MSKLITLALILSSCGTQNSGSSSGTAAKEETGVATSYYVATESELVTCDASRKGYLAYIKNTAEFKACLEAGWTKVDVKGKDGSNGSNGASGSAGTMVSGNQWYDAVTTKMWVMTNISANMTGFTDAQSTCSGAYRIPTSTEAIAALAHGMGVMAQAMSSAPTFIVVSGYSSGGKQVRISDGAYMVQSTGAQFCIQQ